MTLGSNRSPYQNFGRSTFVIEFGDPAIIPRGTIVRPSRERMPYGPDREAPGDPPTTAGFTKPEPGPFPDDLFSATDISELPWTRRRGDEWTDSTFRALVLEWLRGYFRARSGLVGWDVAEIATGSRTGATRLSAKRQFLRVGVTRRVGDGLERVESSIDFEPDFRVSPYVEARLAILGTTLDALFSA